MKLAFPWFLECRGDGKCALESKRFKICSLCSCVGRKRDVSLLHLDALMSSAVSVFQDTP